jgi:membrane dipeptidase
MHSSPVVLAFLALAACTRAPASVVPGTENVGSIGGSARIAQLLREHPVFDGHNDLPWAIHQHRTHPQDPGAFDLRARTEFMTDIPRLRRGGVGMQFWSIYIPGEPTHAAYRPNGLVSSVPGYARVQLQQIDIARRIFARYPELAPVTTVDGIERARREGRIASLMGMEGGHAIENSLALLRQYHALGARYMTLTHNVTLDWADAASDTARHGGLTPFGESVVREMNRLGMLVDLSHVSPATMSDALNATRAPVIFSHSNARALCDHVRNVPDSILARLPRNGGVVMVTFVPSFTSQASKVDDDSLDAVELRATQQFGADSAARRAAVAAWRASHPRPRATLAQVADHIDHIRRVAGADHVGLGGDFDGISENVVGLEDVSTYPALLDELARRGWSDADLGKLTSGNILRVMREAERVSAELQR